MSSPLVVPKIFQIQIVPISPRSSAEYIEITEASLIAAGISVVWQTRPVSAAQVVNPLSPPPAPILIPDQPS